jgi:hypothetical protein
VERVKKKIDDWLDDWLNVKCFLGLDRAEIILLVILIGALANIAIKLLNQ